MTCQITGVQIAPTRPHDLVGNMSLREYFAAAAMQGAVSSNYTGSSKEIAEAAVMYADSLIKELNKQKD
jgi:hypothetical protein